MRWGLPCACHAVPPRASLPAARDRTAPQSLDPPPLPLPQVVLDRRLTIIIGVDPGKKRIVTVSVVLYFDDDGEPVIKIWEVDGKSYMHRSLRSVYDKWLRELKRYLLFDVGTGVPVRLGRFETIMPGWRRGPGYGVTLARYCRDMAVRGPGNPNTSPKRPCVVTDSIYNRDVTGARMKMARGRRICSIAGQMWRPRIFKRFPHFNVIVAFGNAPLYGNNVRGVPAMPNTRAVWALIRELYNECSRRRLAAHRINVAPTWVTGVWVSAPAPLAPWLGGWGPLHVASRVFSVAACVSCARCAALRGAEHRLGLRRRA